jgi:plastocyanin
MFIYNSRSKKVNKRILISISVLGLVFLAACGGSKEPPLPIEVTIEMSEYAFSPADLEFQVGQEVTINLINVGSLDHEIMFGRDVAMMDNRPSGYEIDLFEVAGVEPTVSMMEGEMADMDDEHEEGEEEDMGHTGFMVLVPAADDMYTITFTVTEEMLGEWEIGCFELEGVHYSAGMFGTMIISN